MTKPRESRNFSPRWAADPAAGPAERLRSPASRTLLAAALASTLLLGAASLAVDRLHPSVDGAVEHAGPAATDEQTRSEVVDEAKAIVRIAALRDVTAGYLLLSCTNRRDPPYQGAIYLDFSLPPDVGADQYFRTVAADLRTHGWRLGPPPHQHLVGATLSNGGVTATLYRQDNSDSHGVARIYGPCRDTTDHRRDPTGWADVSDQLR